MKQFIIIVGFLSWAHLCFAAQQSVFIEDLTWNEVQTAIASGKTVAIYFSGSTEQNGPHMVLGKHNFIAHYVAGEIAKKLGNALVYPTMPFAPTGDAVKKTGHMRFPGSITLSDEVFGEVARQVALSAISAGFKTVFLMGDHGGGLDALEKAAEDLDEQNAPHRAHVYYIDAQSYTEPLRLYLRAHHLPPEDHGGIDETSELLYIEKNNEWIRKDAFAPSNPDMGVEGDPRGASAELGNQFISMKTADDLRQMHDRLNGVLPLAPVLRKTMLQNGVQAAIALYNQLRKDEPKKYDFSERQLNRLGYELYDAGKFADAIELFKVNVTQFPNSWDVYDSLAEGYLALHDKQHAIANYKRSLQLNPDNANATKQLQELGSPSKN